MKYKLKKCPFCGENARVFHIPENNKYENSEHPLWEWKFPGKYVVGCDTPLCVANMNNSLIYTDEEYAVEVWNKIAGEKDE